MQDADLHLKGSMGSAGEGEHINERHDVRGSSGTEKQDFVQEETY